MNISSVIGTKLDQSQGYLENGKRVPVSAINVAGNVICQVKTMDHDGYNALQIGFGTQRKATKAISGHTKKAGLEQLPRFFREIRVDETPDFELGTLLDIATILEPGDVIDVTGTSKGKGYAGSVKRHGFAGGPRTHGQSDRERAPGSSGQGTTPGRVYKGKRMAGRMGSDTVTVKNLEVLDIQDGVVIVRGLIPGPKGTLVTITRVSKNKKFVPLYKVQSEVVEADGEVAEIAKAPEEAIAEESFDSVQDKNISAEVLVEDQSASGGELESTAEAIKEETKDEAVKERVEATEKTEEESTSAEAMADKKEEEVS